MRSFAQLRNLNICHNLPQRLLIFAKFSKHFDENLINCWDWNGAKACKSCRSCQELSNECLLAKFGFDTAENEPEYGYGISLIFVSLIFGPADLCWEGTCTPRRSWMRTSRRRCRRGRVRASLRSVQWGSRRQARSLCLFMFVPFFF